MSLSNRFRLDPNTFGALRSNRFKIFLFTQAIAMTGVWIQKIATSWLVYRLTESSFKLGLIELLGNAPMFIIGLIAGAWLDKHDKRKTLIAAQLFIVIHSLVLSFLTYTDLIQYWHILLLSLFMGITIAIELPARQSALLLMIDKKEYIKSAVSLQSIVFNTSRLVGPSIAGFIIYYLGEKWCFIISTILFIPVVVTFFFLKFNADVKNTTSNKKNMFQDVVEGIKYVKNYRPLRIMFVFLSVFGFFSYTYAVMFPIYAKDILGGQSQLLGFLMGFFGLGAIFGAFTVASKMNLNSMAKSISKASFLYVFFMFIFAISTNEIISLLAVIPAGFGLIATFIGSNTMFQFVSADHMRSRVISLYLITNVGLGPIGCFVAGYLMEYISPQTTMVIWCIIMFLASLYLFINLKHAKSTKDTRLTV